MWPIVGRVHARSRRPAVGLLTAGGESGSALATLPPGTSGARVALVRRYPVWPWVVAALAVALGALATVLSALAGPHGSPWWEDAAFCLVVLASVVVGLLVAVRQPGNPIGWLVLANGPVVALFGFAEAYAQYAVLEDPGALPGGRWAVLADHSLWPLLFAPVAAIALIFPDGRLPSPRWRRTAVGAAAVVRGAARGPTLRGREVRSAIRARDEPDPRAARHRVAVAARLPRRRRHPGRGGVGGARALPARHRDRAAPAEVARLRGLPGPGDGAGVPRRSPDHGRRHRPHGRRRS